MPDTRRSRVSKKGKNTEAEDFVNSFLSSKPVPQWLRRALSGRGIDNPDRTKSTVQTMSIEVDGVTFLIPTIREIDGEITKLSSKEAIQIFRKKKDGLPFRSSETADRFSRELSKRLQ